MAIGAISSAHSGKTPGHAGPIFEAPPEKRVINRVMFQNMTFYK
jgi:hypothetical protein